MNCKVLWLALVYSSTAAWAQSISASLNGIVQDSLLGRVSGAVISVVNRNTNAEMRVVSDADGSFRITSIAPGEYALTVRASGFTKYVVAPIALTVGQNRTITATLQPEAQVQEITVAADAVSDIELDSGGSGKTYNALQMNDLPNISGGQGRNFRTQVYLTPSVAPTTTQHRPFAVAGARSRNNSYQIDSNDYNEIEGGLLMGRGTSEQLLSVEALQGMQVLTHNYKAEYGRNNGAIISMITKSGTNNWHGSLYEYLRNETFSARNTFDVTRPPLKTHQPGVTIGGPIRKDRTFIFSNYEAYLRRSASATTIQTLTPDQKAQAVLSVKPLVAMYPDPNIAGTNLFRSSVPQNGSLHTFLGRADHTLTNSQKLFARSIYLTTYTETIAGAALSRGHRDIGSQSHSLHHSWTPASNVLNEARFQFTRFKIADAYDDPLLLGDTAVNGETGQVAVGGLTTLGHFAFMTQRNFQNSVQSSNDTSVQFGRHALKTGVAIRRQQLNNGRYNNAFAGQLRFLNVATFLAGTPVSYSRTAGNPFVGLRATEFNTYVQDDWQLHPRFMLNVGLRYELNTVPVEVNGLIPEK